MLIDLDEVSTLCRGSKYFSHNKFNFFSFHEKDFGKGGDDLRGYIETLANHHGCDVSGKIFLMFYPRILGYAFNPIATYFCYDKDDRLSVVNHEVRNTFGGKHSYFAKVDRDQPLSYNVDKKLHVSPFMQMDSCYRFRIKNPSNDFMIAIRQTDKEGGILNAVFAGERETMTDKTLLKAFFSYPLMTVKIIAGIHWEAIKLIFKGMKLLPDPGTPKSSVTYLG